MTKNRDRLLQVFVLSVLIIVFSIAIAIRPKSNYDEAEAAAANPMDEDMLESDAATVNSTNEDVSDAFKFVGATEIDMTTMTTAPAVLGNSDAPSQSPSTVATSQPSDGVGAVTFFAVGDVPYTAVEACLLPYELDKLADLGGSFIVHLGDIQDGKSSSCPESMHRRVSQIFESSPVPAFFVIGDNGWLDCENPEESYELWNNHLFFYEERTDLKWPPLGADVIHHSNYSEFWSFELDKVLFIGQGLPAPRHGNVDVESDEWQDYMTANAEWTAYNLEKGANQALAVVIFGHSLSSTSDGGPTKAYFEQLKGIAMSNSNLPFLFIEDYHWWEDAVFDDVPNLRRIALDDTITPTSITVDLNAAGGVQNIFQYNRRCWCTNDHRPTRLITYEEGSACEGACATNLCMGESRCGADDGADCN